MFLSFLLFFLSSLFFHFSWVSSLTEDVLTALLMINWTRCCKTQVKYSFIFLLFSFCLALSLTSHFLFLFSSSAIDLFLALQKISLRRTWQCLWMSSYERSTIAFILLFILTLFLFYFSSIIYSLFLSCYCLLFLFLQNIFINHTSRSFWHIVFYSPCLTVADFGQGQCDLHLISLYVLFMLVGTVTFNDPAIRWSWARLVRTNVIFSMLKSFTFWF